MNRNTGEHPTGSRRRFIRCTCDSYPTGISRELRELIFGKRGRENSMNTFQKAGRLSAQPEISVEIEDIYAEGRRRLVSLVWIMPLPSLFSSLPPSLLFLAEGSEHGCAQAARAPAEEKPVTDEATHHGVRRPKISGDPAES